MLENLGWIERDSNGKRLFLGAELAMIGLSAQLRHPIDGLIRPVLFDLSRETGQTFYLTIRSGNDSVCVARNESESVIRTLVLEVGSREPLGIGAGSMAMLAALPDNEAQAVVAANLDRYSARSAFDETIFRERLLQARQKGFAAHEGLFTRGVSGIGVPVCDSAGYPVAAISTAFIAGSLDASEELRYVRRMELAAREVARLMGS